MEPLSPRSTNILPKPKPEPTKSASAKPMPTDKPASAEKPHNNNQKNQKDPSPSPPSSVREPGKNGERYTTGEFLGKGGFAVCHQGELSRNNRIFAMKVVKSEMSQRKMQDKFRTELQIHSKMRHPNIVAFHRAFTFEKNIYVILELCSNGSIMEMVKRRKCLTLPEVRRFMVQLSGAVKYLHKRNVAHRDLKMGNMFLDHNMDIKVGDFGLAAIILSEKDERRRKTLCGTPNYIAPEVLDKSKGGHTQKVDIWSIGVIIFAMLAGYPPFQSSTQEEIYKKVKNLSYAWPKDKEPGNYIPNEAKSLVSVCLSLDENERPEPDEIVDHPFFNMYPGCIPRQLESECRHTRPAWIKHQDPRGDRMSTGCSLENDSKYSTKITKVRGWEERYAVCKHEFYAECGVGKTPSGVTRKSVGKRCSKTAWAECAAEEALGLQPLMPLPIDRVYSYHAASGRDWSVTDAEIGNESTSSTGDDEEQDNKVASKIQAAKAARSQQALATQLRRKDAQPKSHAATLRQPAPQPAPAPATRTISRGANVRNVQPDPQATGETAKANEPEPLPSAQNLLSERPIRSGGGRVGSGYQGSLRERARPVSTVLPKSESVPVELTAGKTRSQSRQNLTSHSRTPSSPERRRRDSAEDVKTRPKTDERMATISSGQRDVRLDPHESREPQPQRVPSPQQKTSNPENPESLEPQNQRLESCAPQKSLPKKIPQPEEKPKATMSVKTETTGAREEPKAEVKPTTSGSQKSRSTLGVGPLIHTEEKPEVMAGTSVSEVIPQLRTYLSEFRQREESTTSTQDRTCRRQQQTSPQHHCPHAYVVKWVDYTNRYGIGYVLDDGSVGCIFKAEQGHPASCVLLRDGERHIRQKARARESPEGPHVYSECGQLVPRKGRPVEFYENVELGTASRQGGGVRRVLIQPALFEVKHLQLSAAGDDGKARPAAGVERPKCEVEKVKRVKLVDQFGKYMIGSLGRGASEDDYPEQDGESGPGSQTVEAGPYVKFYQRLGNVGIWGFGDGAFQFNFPDHTKVVISLRKSHHSSRSTFCQIDFYHLSPSAARYLASRGKMHPSGFDTRSGISEDAYTFLETLTGSAAGDCQPVSDISTARFREILEANSFRDKMDFIEDVLTSWVRNGRLGGRITSGLSRYSSSSSFSRVASASSASSAGTTSSTATTRSNGTGSLSSTLSTAPTSLGSCEHPQLQRAGTELFWAGAQEKSWESPSGGKFVWVSVGAQGGDGEYMSLVLKGNSGTGEVQCVGAEAQDELTERLKALASAS